MDSIWNPCGIHVDSLEQKLRQRQGLNPTPLDQQSHDKMQLTTKPNRHIYVIELVVFITLLNKFLIKKKVERIIYLLSSKYCNQN